MINRNAHLQTRENIYCIHGDTLEEIHTKKNENKIMNPRSKVPPLFNSFILILFFSSSSSFHYIISFVRRKVCIDVEYLYTFVRYHEITC